MPQKIDAARCGAGQPGDRLDERRLPVALYPGKPDHLARAYGEADIVNGHFVVFAQNGQVIDPQQHLARGKGGLFDLEPDRG